MKFLYKFISLVLFSSITLAQPQQQPQPAAKTIGIILPIQHRALNAIVEGFTETLQKGYAGKITFDVQNAQGDMNLQRAIIQKFINQKVDMFVPVTTSSAQMTMSMIHEQPIVALAAMIPEADRQKLAGHNMTGVQDEISPAKQVAFVHGLLPQLKKFTLIYSSTDKIIPQTEEVVAQAKTYGITVQKLMIQNLADLYTMAQRIANDSQAIVILKDNVVASGINTLIQTAYQRHLPLITADEGTVSSGAAAALGVREKDIGSTGAELALRVLKGEPIARIPMQEMTKLLVFINTQACEQQGLNVKTIENFAAQQNYQVLLNPKVA